MQILEFDDPPREKFGPGCVVSVGNFDGVHRGHQAILARNVALARERKLNALVLTFEPHPAVFFNADNRRQRLTLTPERARRIGEVGPDFLWLLHFRREIANLCAEEFVRDWLLRKIGLRCLVVGGQFALGRGREGTAARLAELGKKLGYEMELCPGVSWRGELISSSRIRRALERGEVEAAAEMLGHPYALEGPIVSGRGRGRRWGVPTLNIESREQQWPADGVYICRAELAGGNFPAAVNIGQRPTFGEQGRLMEAHLLDYRGQEIGAAGRFLFYRRLRDELRYEDPRALYQQIEIDLQRTLDFFKKPPA